MPLTYKVLSGFTILNDKMYKDVDLNRLGDSGITVVQPITGGGRVLHGKTTTQSGYPEEEEISIVFVRDQIARTMRRSFTAYIGQPEDASLAATLTSRAISLLGAFVSQGWITAYANLSVNRDDVEPRQWNISVQIAPSYPTCWIFIDVSVGTI
jgi:lipoate-protein ligase A